MTDREGHAPAGDEPDCLLVELTEQIAERLQAGEPVKANDYLDRYPQWADTIREILPTMTDLVAYGRTAEVDRVRRQEPSAENPADDCQLLL